MHKPTKEEIFKFLEEWRDKNKGNDGRQALINNFFVPWNDSFTWIQEYDEHVKAVPKSTIFENIDKELLKKFKAYHEKNPHIFREFKRYATEMRQVRSKSSAWLIVNRIRWDKDIHSNADEEFKIANEYIALYARLLIHNSPEFEGFFNLKKMKSEMLSMPECNTL